MTFRLRLAVFLSIVGLGCGIGLRAGGGGLAVAPTNVLNTAADLNGKTLVTAEGNRTITGTFSFNVPIRLNPGTTSAPGLVSTSDQTTGWQLGVGAISGSLSATQQFLLNASGLTLFSRAVFNSSGNLSINALNGGASASASTFYRGDSAWIQVAQRGCDVRATLTSGVPVTTTDVTGATNVYIDPYNGSGGGPAYCAFYNFSGEAVWRVVPITEVTVALGTLTSGLPYDIFCYASGAVTMGCDAPVAWTNGTTRATNLAVLNGVPVKSGDTTRRYIATFYTSSTTTTEDSLTKGFLWNFYNRKPRILTKAEATASWTYVTTAALREARNQTTNIVEFVLGSADVPITGSYSSIVGSDNVSLLAFRIGVGLDSTTAFASNQHGNTLVITSGEQGTGTAFFSTQPAVGYHYAAMLEGGNAGATATFYGTGTYDGASRLIATTEH